MNQQGKDNMQADPGSVPFAQMDAVVHEEDLPPFTSLEDLMHECSPQFPPANLDIPDILHDNSGYNCQQLQQHHLQQQQQQQQHLLHRQQQQQQQQQLHRQQQQQQHYEQNLQSINMSAVIKERSDMQMSQMQQTAIVQQQQQQQQQQQRQRQTNIPATTPATTTTTSPNTKNKIKSTTTKKSRKKRDPNEPQKPVSAYALFFRDSQATIKTRNPNMSFGEVSKLVAHMWEDLDAENKAMYRKRTETAKKEYLKQLAAYRASLVSKGPMDGETNWSGASSGSSADGSPPPAATTYLAASSSSSNVAAVTNSMSTAQRAYCGGGVGEQQTVLQNGEIMCVRQGCQNSVVHDPAWDRDYCSNECVATHCRDVFNQWIARQNQTSVK